MKVFVNWFKTEMRAAGLYRADFLLRLCYSFIAMYGVCSLWQALYRQDPGLVGRPLQAMVTYAMLAVALDIVFYPSALKSAPQNYIADQVRTGRIDTDLLRPRDLQSQLLTRNAAGALFSLLWLVLPAWLLGVFFLGMELPATALCAVAFAVSVALGFFILFSLNFLLGLVCFVTLDIRQITMAYSGILTILSGKLIPNWLYPEWMQAVIRALPFRCIFEMPLNIYTGALAEREIVLGICLQGFWALALFCFGRLAWRKVHRRLSVQGG